MSAILELPIINSPAMWIIYAVAVAFTVTLLIRKDSKSKHGKTKRWLPRALIGIAAGAIVGFLIYLAGNALDLFGVELPGPVGTWAAATFAGIGLAIASFPHSKPWRKIVASVSILAYLVAGATGINALYGLNPTLGSVFGIVEENQITLPDFNADNRAAPTQPLASTWQAPADMPSVGERGSVPIPGTTSGFVARDAGIYLPPAALVENAPALPVVIMMMGYVGNPDPTIISDVLDQFAADHNGLAPIVVVADQLGGQGDVDPACADSAKYGNAETYVTTDVVNWVNANLNVIQDPKYWTVAGYSNGGGCAAKYGAKDPGTFKNIISVSGEQYPGSETPDAVQADIYGGDAAAFEASKPINIFQAAPAGTYAGMTAIFTAGSEDPDFVSMATTVSNATQALGINTTLFIVQGADHGGDAVSGGLTEGFNVLYPVLGLSTGS
ncbi:alpha/beta hydrolase [Pseudoclavibacter terrae]|uniref:Esterase n=1 Tax=Pseudoclavibacter terrae TaxID=1530195 RepID=A0A7J5B2J0_9MICO|nr:alpha/beta hydrolase-fold protein [Pseudoclavibacter terrae]KAB1638222.1 esterase [Pseudoclavibacter terrae]